VDDEERAREGEGDDDELEHGVLLPIGVLIGRQPPDLTATTA